MGCAYGRIIIDAGTRLGAVFCHDGDRHKSTAEEHIQDNGEKCEEGEAAEEACQDDSENCI